MSVSTPRRITAADRRAAARVYRRIVAAVGTTPVGGVDGIDQVVRACARASGRPIHLRAVDGAAWRSSDGPEGLLTGLAVSREAEDLIIVRDDVTGRHRDHIVAHELAHLLFDHAGLVPAGLVREAPCPSEVVHGRISLATRQEREAEALADLVCTRLLGAGASPRDRYDFSR